MLSFVTTLTRGSFLRPPKGIIDHVDDDELPKNGPIRIKGQRSSTHVGT
jgi:hypothetical protein